MIDVCESPIESMMLSALVSACWVPHEVVVGTRCNDVWRMAMADEHRQRVFIAPQSRFENLRIDILLARWRGGIAPTMIAIECDGHEFHMATREQRERDFRRDCLLASRGIRTVRFSGGRIARNSVRCAREALVEVTGERREVFGREAMIERRSGVHREIVDDGRWLDGVRV